MPIVIGSKGATLGGVNFPPYMYVDWLDGNQEALLTQGGDAVSVPARSPAVTAYTRDQLLAVAASGLLTPGAVYLTSEGAIMRAVTAYHLAGTWVSRRVPTAVGGATAWANFYSVNLPPIRPGGAMLVRVRGDCTNSAQTHRFYVLGGGTAADAPGGGVADSIIDKNFNTSNPVEFYIEMQVDVLASGVAQARASGTSQPGINNTPSLSRYLLNDYTVSRLLRLVMLTALSGTDVDITGLQVSGGYAYGAVAAGTFTDLALTRTCRVTGAADAAYNLNPIDVQLLSAGLPTPVVAALNTATSGLTLFRYPCGASGAAGGAPKLQTYNDLTVRSLEVIIDQGAA